jgi:hypothetical protein
MEKGLEFTNFTVAEKTALDTLIKSVNWTNQQERQAIAETIVKMVYDSVSAVDLTSLMCDVETFELGQAMQFSTARGAKAFIHEPGTFAPMSTIIKKTLDLYDEMTSVNLLLNILELKSGRYGSIVDIKRDMAKELLGAKYAAIWNTFKGAIVTGDTNYGTIAASATADQKLAILTPLLQAVADNGSQAKCIVGRYPAVGWITDVASPAYSEEYKGQRDRYGFLGSFRGIPIIYLTKYTDGWNQERIDDDNLFVIADGCGKLGVKLSNFVMEDVNASTFDWNIHTSEIYGCGVVFPEKCARMYFS